MATVGERLATLEEQVRALREDVADLRGMIGDRRDPESIRGRLHKIEGVLGSFVMRRAPGSLLKGWQRVALTLCAIATAVAAWYHVVAG